MAQEIGRPTTLARNLRGAGFMALSMLGFACNDALMKGVAPEIGVYQSILMRSVFGGVIAALLVWRFRAWTRPPRRDWPWLAVRSAGEIGAVLLYLNAILRMRLAEVSAINQTMPLLLTLIGAVFLGETVGWRRWLAIAAGFTGVLIIVQPGPAGFDPDALWAVGAMLCFCTRDVATRMTSDATPSLLITLITMIGVGAMGSLGTAVEGWAPMAPWTWLAALGAATAVFAGYFGGVQALRTGEIAFTAPFRYTILLWAMLLGFVFFAETPDAGTLVGAAVIVAAGLYAFWRERKAGLAAVRAETEETA